MTSRKYNIAIITNSFPNFVQPHRGVYIKQIVDHMGDRINPFIVCPLPWFPKFKFLKSLKNWQLFAEIPRQYSYETYQVCSPKYIVIPKISSPISGLLMIAGMYLAFYKLVRRKRIDLIHAHNIYPEGVAAIWFGKNFNVPVVLSARGSDINDLIEKNSIRFHQTVWALKNSSNITAVSRPLCNKIAKLGADVNRIHFIPNGVDNKKFYFQEKNFCRHKLGLKSINKILLFVGKLRSVKGLHYLIEALSILKQEEKLDFHTIIIGGGYLEDKLTMAARERQLQHDIFFKGNLPPNQINDWMGASDLFCLPSLKEGMPNVILEALSCGVPVVATSVGGIPGLINGHNGVLAKAANAHSLANAIKKGFERKWDCQKICRTVSHLNWENCAMSYLNVIESAMSPAFHQK